MREKKVQCWVNLLDEVFWTDVTEFIKLYDEVCSTSSEAFFQIQLKFCVAKYMYV